jgi:hypothetical protein
MERLAQTINGGLDFGVPTPPATGAAPGVPTVSTSGLGNVSGVWVTVNTGPANTTFTVTHNLGRIPNGMLVFSVDQPGAVIHAVNKNLWTTKVAYFQSNVANVNLTGFVS